MKEAFPPIVARISVHYLLEKDRRLYDFKAFLNNGSVYLSVILQLLIFGSFKNG